MWSLVKEKYMAYRHGTIILVYMVFYMMMFSWLETRRVYDYHVIHTFLDDFIPFHEIFIIPYLLWFPYMIGTVVYFIFKPAMKNEYYRLISNLMMGMSVFLMVSFLWPNMLELRPTEFARDNILTDAVKWLYRTDTPTNVLPSIHVFNSLACEVAVFTSPNLRKRKVLQAGSMVLTGSIILSTMFLKQHSVVDVCLGSAMALLGYHLFYTQPVALEGRRELAMAQAGKNQRR